MSEKDLRSGLDVTIDPVAASIMALLLELDPLFRYNPSRSVASDYDEEVEQMVALVRSNDPITSDAVWRLTESIIWESESVTSHILNSRITEHLEKLRRQG